jgi:hypothetical protein
MGTTVTLRGELVNKVSHEHFLMMILLQL